MDFDEYEYLEKTVETVEPEKLKEKVNTDEETVKSEGGEGRQSSKHKSEKNGDDKSHRSKRVKSGDEKGDGDRERSVRDKERGHRGRERGERDKEKGGRDRERGDHDREKGSSRHRSSSRDVEKSERGRKRSTREHKDREKDKGRKEKIGKGKDRDQDRERGADKEKDCEREKRVLKKDNDKEKDKGSGRERSQRSKSRPERQKDEPDREKHRDKELREREKEEESKEPDLMIRRPKEKREEVVEPEVDPERDQRTVFAYQICLKADERDVYEFFSRAGKVRDVRLIMDRNSRRSKGVGYIEFYDAMSVPMAIALSGQTLLSQPVMVKPSEAEKNLVQSTTSAAGGPGGGIVPYSGGARRLYVGNLHYNIREDQLRQVFESFGSVELVQLPLDQVTGNGKGYGFVQFARLEDARAAESLNGQLEIAGRAIKVSAITDQAGMQDVGANPGDFDDDEGGGLSLNARSRAILMQKLDRSGTTSSVTSILGIPGVSTLGSSQPETSLPGTASTVSSLVNPLAQAPVPPLAGLLAAGSSVPTVNVPSFDIVGVPSECLLLKNMFDPNSESEPDFDLDIKEDVQEESSKYGTLKHIYVDKNTAGFVYLRFDNTEAAVSAQRALHGRWFAGKMITATFMLPQNYESRFPDSR
ncbi:hypothetical protein DCAR_0103364 [Daucus carota subsp. sativus]|uniref:RRM domain-containing protein n=1 Tax=Daucus carota subsp. sativus TaxID=79200 RepID=A0AAF0W9G7_DAUCS|nr:PREDICTED: RNA-binding protein 39-like isoform X1 [Daucus carota subsp. sativus]WOG84183.1 hypothetical protein DCAR_0103364 [Daucus carota subsp. sativus]